MQTAVATGRHIEIRNESSFRSEHLQKFASIAAAQVFGENEKPYLRITFKSRRGMSCSGCAYINGIESTVRIGLDGAIGTPEQMRKLKRDLALVLVHEFGHNAGIRHREMSGDPKWRRVGDWQERVDWADDLPLEFKPIGGVR